jgi:hypothetical protein
MKQEKTCEVVNGEDEMQGRMMALIAGDGQ